MHYWLYACILLTSMGSFSKDFENDPVQNQQEQNESTPVPISFLLNEAYQVMRQNNQQPNVISPQQLDALALQIRFLQYHYSPSDPANSLDSSDSDTN